MKIKQLPEDFIVEEVSSRPLKGSGKFQIYLLEKKGLDTFGAKRIIGKEFKISSQEIGIAGLKDKHALTRQFISFPSRYRIPDDWVQQSIRLKKAGFSDQPIKLGEMDSNRFTITLRDIKEGEVEALRSLASKVLSSGVPNYFDSQRFGSLRGSGSFIAKHLIREDWQSAVKILLTSFSRHDPATVRNCRKQIAACWQDWDACLKACKDAPRARREKKILSYLKEHDSGFKGAFLQVEQELQKMFIAAYQSFLWNETVKILISRYTPAVRLRHVKYEAGILFFPIDPPTEFISEIERLEVPLLRPNMNFQDDNTKFAAIKVCKDQGITVEGLDIKGYNIVFREGVRKAWIKPKIVASPLFSSDEINSETKSPRVKMTLSFELQSGSYATLMLKAMGAEKKRRR